MAEPLSESQPAPPADGSALGRFGAGLTESEVIRFKTILREECGVDLPLPQAWSRAIELLSLVESLLKWREIVKVPPGDRTEFALPPS